MIIDKKSVYQIGMLLFCTYFSLCGDTENLQQDNCQEISYEKTTCKWRHRKPHVGPQIGQFLGEFFYDVFDLHLQFLHWDSFKIITTVFPFFIAARMIDEKLQHCFYVRSHHRNVNQLPRWCERFAELSLGIPIVFFGINAFFAREEEFRTACQVFIIGMPFVVFGKKLVKKIRFDAGLRPWNQFFSCTNRAPGGFPSGHLAEATYMAILFGMRFGPKCAIPLALLAAGIGLTFLNCNRHYVSQMVAGAGFGALYAFAADKLISKKLDRDICFKPTIDSSGKLALSFLWRF